MEKERIMGIIESILFAAGREVTIKELMTVLEAESIDIISIVNEMKENYEKEDRGIQIINVDGAYQLCTKKKNYDYICQIFDKRAKLQLSQSAMETLSIIAYNPRITRAEIEAIRGVSSDGVIYKLLDYNLIAESKEFEWMKNNAYNYGFILRYPEYKENITGFKYEPWHYRYVGKEVAKYIYENKLSLEEYFSEKSN